MLITKHNLQKQTYQNYELEKREPDIETLKKLADYYDVSIDYICGRPRPYDLPSYVTKEQKEAIAIILKLNTVNALRAISYCLGLLTNQG